MSYPPPPPYPAAPPRKRNRGCLIGAIVAAVALVVLCGAGGLVVFFVVDKAQEVVPGDAECPTAADVSDVVGYQVEKFADADIVVASGCNYSGSDVGVSIVKGSGLIADDEIATLEQDARNAGVEAEPIDVGEDGVAFGSATRSEAITKADDGVVGVEIFAEQGQDIGDRRAEAVELLELFLDLQ